MGFGPADVRVRAVDRTRLAGAGTPHEGTRGMRWLRSPTQARLVKLTRLARHPSMWPCVAPGLRAGVFPSLEHLAVPFGQDFQTVLDVGASRGQFALFSRWRFPDARIISFEPLPAAQASAERVLYAVGGELRPIALGAVAGTAVMHVAESDDSSSLLPITERQRSIFPKTAERSATIVTVDTLASHLTPDLPRPLLLKVDVQGYEREVFDGAGASLARADEVLVEASFVELYSGQALAGEIIGLLVAQGLKLVDVTSLTRGVDGTAVQADLLFRRAPLVDQKKRQRVA